MSKAQTVFSNLIWRFAERCGAQGVEFIVAIVLARLLEPEVYGTIALVTVFTAILQVFVDCGMGNALIQKKDADELDFSSVFYFNLLLCIVLYVGIFVAAPYIAAFYDDLSLIPIIRVLSITLILSGVRNVQQAYVSRNLMFRKFFFSTLGGTLGAAIIGIVFAYQGFGVWALVLQYLINATVNTIILWFTVRWHPRLLFSIKRLKALFSYGWKLLFSSLLDTVYNNLRQLIIGKMYSTIDLAFFNKGKQVPNLFITNINASINSVLLPVMSQEQDKCENVKNMTRLSIKVSTFVIAPIMMGLFCTAPALISILLGDKWLLCVPFLRIYCITYMFYPIHTANLSAIKAMGRSDIFLKLEILKKMVGLGLLFATMRHGVMAMAYSLLLSSFASQLINCFPNRRLLKYGYFEQLKDIMPAISLAIGMSLCVNLLNNLPLNGLWILLIQVLTGVTIYVVGAVVFKMDTFFYLVKTLKKMK